MINFNDLWRSLIGKTPEDKEYEAKQAENRMVGYLAGYEDLDDDEKADLLTMYQNEQN